MNWDAILTAALIVITAFSAIAVGIQTVLKVQDRERDQILEEVQDFLTPTINHLKEEIKAIEEHKILWQRYPSGRGDFKVHPYKLLDADIKDYGSAARDFFSKYPYLNGKFSSHDALHDKLYAAYATIERNVKTPELKERLKVLVNKFNEFREGSNRLDRVFLENPDIIFGNFIINCEYEIERSPDSVQPHINFWEAYRDELLEFRNALQIKELDEEIERLLRQLKELDEELLEALVKIREGYRVKYKFTESQIVPELKKIETVM